MQKHFNQFARSRKLWNSSDTLYVAVSGGVDSVVLLDLIVSCGYYSDVQIVHINHSTRKDNFKDQKLVAGLAKKYDLKLHSFTLEKLNSSNFEARARVERYKIFNKFKDGKVLLGHHIDDSFEWSLMQKFKSSTLESTIGVPLFNKHYRRPLMCATKNQIRNYATIAKLNFNEDITNRDNNFERNFVRNEIIPKIKLKYPKYLKHYVNQSNALITSRTEVLKTKFKTIKRNDGVLIYCFSDKIESIGLKQVLYKSLAAFDFYRGKTSSQIDSIVSAHLNHKKGPLLLSGGLKVYIEPNLLFMTKSFCELNYKFKSFNKYDLNQFKNILSSLFTSNNSYPFYVHVRKKSFNFQESKTIDGIRLISPCKLVKYWSKHSNTDHLLEIALPAS